MKTNNNFTVLIVDDEKLNIELAAAYLQEDGYNIAFATDALSVINNIITKKIDLILLDINMPNKNGFEVCQILKEDVKTKDIPIIFLTSQTDIDSISRAFEVGGVDYINKPFNGIELKSRVKTHLQATAYLEEIKHKQSKLAQLTITDPLTKLSNSLHFDAQIKSRLEKGESLWLLYIKIKNFDKINTIYGFYGANKILRLFAKIITQASPSNAIVAKLYGVGFGVIVKNYDKNTITEIGKNIRLLVSKDSDLKQSIFYCIVYLNLKESLSITSIYKKLLMGADNAIENDTYDLFLQ